MKIIYPPPTAVAGGLAAANNLSDIASAASARENLEVLSADEVQIQKMLRDRLLISAGATPNRAQVQTGTTRTALASAPAATWRGLVYVPTSNPSASLVISGMSGSSTADPASGSNGLSFYIQTTGGLKLRSTGSSSAYYRDFSWSGFRAAYSGQWVVLEAYLVQGTTAPVVRANDIDISSNFTSATTSPTPDWLDAALDTTYTVSGINWPSGPAPLGCWINGALSDADRTYWRETGLPPKWVVDGGSMVALQSSNYSASADGFATNSSLTLTLTAGVTKDAETNTLQVTATNTGTGQYQMSGWLSSTELDGVKQLEITGKIWIATGAFTAPPYLGAGYSGVNKNQIAHQAIALDQWVNFRMVTVENYRPRFAVFNAASGSTSQAMQNGSSLWLKDVKIRQLGALSLPVQGPDGYVLDGTRQTPANIGTLTGMAWNNPLPVGSTIAVNKYFAHDDISATAATTTFMTLPAGWAIESYHRGIAGGAFFDAGVTISVGYTSSATEFISADAVDATYNKGVASSRVGPLSLAAGLAYAIYLKKSGATTVGAAYITLVLKRIF